MDSRTVRLRLAPKRDPYWRVIQQGRAIGYRRLAGGKAGTWIARLQDADHGRVYHSLGSADDLIDADGRNTLTFAQAQTAAHTWFSATLAGERVAVAKPVTVAEAVAHYLDDYTARGGKALAAVRMTINAFILPALGSRPVASLTSVEVKKWHGAIAKAPARLRTGKASKPREAVPMDADALRARRSSANRVMSVLKAILNLAYRDGLVASDDAWRRVRPFQKVESPVIRFLDDAEAKRLVNACPAEFRQMVVAALLTGARYGELAVMRAADLDLDAGTLHIPVSKGGTARHIHLTSEGVELFRTLTAGRDRGALVLTRGDAGAWGKSHQHRPLQIACGAARISPAISFHVLRHTYASRLARSGVSMLVIAAQLGHADTRITVKHYAHLAPDHVAQAVRAGFSDMLLVEKTNVVSIGIV